MVLKIFTGLWNLNSVNYKSHKSESKLHEICIDKSLCVVLCNAHNKNFFRSRFTQNANKKEASLNLSVYDFISQRYFICWHMKKITSFNATEKVRTAASNLNVATVILLGSTPHR